MGFGGENPLVSWSSCEFDLKERRERGCDRAATDVCQISTLSTKLVLKKVGSRVGSDGVVLGVSKIWFSSGFFRLSSKWVRKSRERSKYVSKNKSAIFSWLFFILDTNQLAFKTFF